MPKQITKPFRVLVKTFKEFSFADALFKKKDQHDSFGDDEPHVTYMDLEQTEDVGGSEADEAMDVDGDDSASLSASLASSVDEIEDGQGAVVSDWAEVTLNLSTSPPPTVKLPPSAPSQESPDATITNAETRRKKKKNAGKKARRSVVRKREKEEQKKVSTAPPAATAPLDSGNHLAPHKLRSSVSKAHLNPVVISAPKPNLRTNSTQPAYVCKQLERSEASAPFLAKLKDEGFKVVPILSDRNRCILDAQGRLVVGVAAPPKDKKPTDGKPPPESWSNCMQHCTVESAMAKKECKLTPVGSARGDFVVLNAGCTHGNGTTEPVNRVFPTVQATKVADRLCKDSRFCRVAAFQDSLLRFYAPKLASYYDTTLEKLYQHDRTLRRPFPCSAYPSVAFNIDSETVCRDHTDAGNFPANLCAITAYGNYNYKLGGHLVLYDLKLIIEFPPGYTILMPSGAMRHGNTAIAKGESRYSMVQYCPGGLIRWVEHGFRPATQVDHKLRKREVEERWDSVINMLSKLDELEDDHRKHSK